MSEEVHVVYEVDHENNLVFEVYLDKEKAKEIYRKKADLHNRTAEVVGLYRNIIETDVNEVHIVAYIWKHSASAININVFGNLAEAKDYYREIETEKDPEIDKYILTANIKVQ